MAPPAQVDSKVPRAKAAFHALLPASAFLLDAVSPLAAIGLVAFTGLAMAASVLGGPRASLFGRLYVHVLRPAFKLSPGEPEAAAPHRFAEVVGVLFLIGSTAALLAGADLAGWVLALIVSALAALNWLAGICVGCQMYLLLKRMGGRGRVAT